MSPRVVQHIRVSTVGQAKADTPAGQRAALDSLLAQRGGRLVERIEIQVSGALGMDERPDLQRLQALARERAFDELHVRHFDRLTRNADPLERAVILSLVRSAGAVIVDASGTVIDPRTMGGEIQWVVTTLAGAEERVKIMVRVADGKRVLAAKGQLTDGRPPWGRTYDVRTHTWGTDEHAAHYRRLFDLARERLSTEQIAAVMNEDGIRPPRGAAWSASGVYYLLQAPHASGTYRTRGHTVEIPAIVDAATQRKALALLASANKNRGPRTITVRALLRGVAFCGECGARMYVRSGADGRHYYYRCARKCGSVTHRADRVDDETRRLLTQIIRRPETLLGVKRRRPEDAAAGAKRDAADAEKELAALDKREEWLARQGGKGLLQPKTVAQQLREVAGLRAAAQERLQNAQARLQSVEDVRGMSEDALAVLHRMRANLDAWTWDDWREVVGAWFRRTATTGIGISEDGTIRLAGVVPLSGAAFRGVKSEGLRPESMQIDTTIRLAR